MLTEDERKEIESQLDHYPQKRAGCVDALKIVQRHRGWVSDEAIEDLADLFAMSAGELDSVATFYNLVFRKPVGRHVILTCNTVSCWIMGCEQLQRQLSESLGIEFGQTSADNRFTLIPVPCLGACERAPAILIDDDLHGDVDPEHIDEILRHYE
jgi:NADH-quinone oxidoreductase subunit E